MLAGNNNKYYYLSYNKKEIETANGLLCHCVFVYVCVCKFVFRVAESKKRGRERERQECKNKTGHSE